MALITETIKRDLAVLYAAEDRFYHGISHIEALLALLEQYRDEFADPHVVEAAIWFHDCIYNTRAKDNEVQSARLAVTRLESQCTTGSNKRRLQLVSDMIKATATHDVPQLSGTGDLSDTLLFLDMDLSILGSDRARFDMYEAAVRKEYSWVSDEAWCAGRAAVLSRFESKPHIFQSHLFRNKYEARARENIRHSLEKLQSQGPLGEGSTSVNSTQL